MGAYTTEIASDKISSDNPIHQRLLKPYYLARQYISREDRLLEIGCGEGRGVPLLVDKVKQYDAVDKIESAITALRETYDQVNFFHSRIPPFRDFNNDTYDIVISFQVIEHIREDKFFLEEIYRVLKPGGKALITTPNIRKTLTRNPWHVREYTAEQLGTIGNDVFDKAEVLGITGNEKIWAYYESNKESVEKIMRFDFLNFQHRLPAFVLRIPYDILNRMNRKKLERTSGRLVGDITHEDYMISNKPDDSLDLFAVLRKA